LDPQQRRRQQTPAPEELGINFIAYANATIGQCPLYSHEKDEEPSDEDEEKNDESPGFWQDRSIIFQGQNGPELTETYTIIFLSTTNSLPNCNCLASIEHFIHWFGVGR
jgi:hypothetical protein